MSSFYNRIRSEADMLEGNISRMCVTSDVKELHSSLTYAVCRLVYIYNARLDYLNNNVSGGVIDE